METRPRGQQTSREETQPLSQVITDPTQIVQEHLHAMENKNFDRARSLLSNDFTFNGATPQPLNIDQYINLHKELLGAFKDWRYNFSVKKAEGNTVQGTVHITGTHTGPLTLTMLPGVQNIKPTGKRISLPEEMITVTIRNNKGIRCDVKSVPDGGVLGLLSQIGVHVDH